MKIVDLIKKLRCITILLSVACFTHARAQDVWDIPYLNLGDSTLRLSPETKVIITGKITDRQGLPLVSASVSMDGFKYFDYSDQNGNYLLELPAGKYRMTVRYVGKQSALRKVRVWSGGNINFTLEENVNTLEEVVVSSRPIDSNIKSALAGTATLNIAEIKKLPTFLGEVDILKSIQLLPGVGSVGEGSAGFTVRGGRTDQNLLLFNGTPIFNASHALGFVSSFNPDVVSNFTLYKGHVPAMLGGRASSVLEVNTRPGNMESWKFQVGAGLAASRLLAEGPIQKDKSSFLVSTRFSNSNWLLGLADNPDIQASRLNFYDVTSSFVQELSPNSSLRLNYFRSYDFFQFSNQFAYDYTNQIANLEWKTLTHRKASPSTLISASSFTNSLIDPDGFDASKLTNQMNYFQFRQLLNYQPTESIQLTTGVESVFYQSRPEELTNYKGKGTVVPQKVDKNSGIEWAGFVNGEVTLGERFSFAGGVRYSGYTHLGSDTVFQYQPNAPRTVSQMADTIIYGRGDKITSFQGLEPRFSVRISPFKSQSIKLGYNRMRQYIHQISNAAAPTPVDIWQIATQYMPPQIADNYSVGYFANLKDNTWELSAEYFYREQNGLIEYKDFPTLFLNRHIETELVNAQGRAYGFELYGRKMKGLWTGWISYTFSRSFVRTLSDFPEELVNRGEWYRANFDKPHAINIVLDKKIGKGGVSWTATYNTGRPITAIESSFIVDGTVIPIYSDRNQYRIPDYFRIDMAITIGSVLKKYEDTLVLSIYNILSRENAYSVFYQTPPNFLIPKPYQLSILGAAFPSLTYNISIP